MIDMSNNVMIEVSYCSEAAFSWVWYVAFDSNHITSRMTYKDKVEGCVMAERWLRLIAQPSHLSYCATWLEPICPESRHHVKTGAMQYERDVTMLSIGCIWVWLIAPSLPSTLCDVVCEA
uniref:Uncharacterized protein n=1 Tax=Hirsutella thompsonii TaxID=42368 RepID=A0A3G2ZP43_HIRTH|nr:hypothetical protein [Hirsutella thompsonii]